MAGYSAVSCFRLNRAVWSLEYRGHETERAEALGNNVGLDVTVVVLAGPYIATVGLDAVGYHVVNETMLIPKTSSFELGFVGRLVYLSKNILEAAVVALEDRVFSGQVQGIVSS